MESFTGECSRRTRNFARRSPEPITASQTSEATIGRFWSKWGIKAAGKTAEELAPEVMRQLVIDQMEKHPSRNRGPHTVYERIRHDTGLTIPRYVSFGLLMNKSAYLWFHCLRDIIAAEMRLLDPEGFEKRAPGARKAHKGQIIVLGPNWEWSGDGYDKLVKLGLPIWALRDVWASFWLGIWVVPNNRKKRVIAYLYPRAVRNYGGKFQSRDGNPCFTP